MLDEADIRHRCRTYRKFLPDTEIAIATAALVGRDVVSWVRDEGLALAVGSGQELASAVGAGVDPREIILQGKAKTANDIRDAVAVGVGRIVIDTPAEVALVAAHRTRPQAVLVRIHPNLDADGAVTEILGRGLTLAGLRCRLATAPMSTAPYVAAVDRMVAECERIRREHRIILTDLDVGSCAGGPELPIRELADDLENALDDACARNRYPRPKLTLEAGRTIVSHAGVSVCRVVAVDHRDAGRAVVVVDGGTSLTPSTAAVVNRHPSGPCVRAILATRDDELAVDVALPADVHPGDVVAIPGAGAPIGRPTIVGVALGKPTRIDVSGADASRRCCG